MNQSMEQAAFEKVCRDFYQASNISHHLSEANETTSALSEAKAQSAAPIWLALNFSCQEAFDHFGQGTGNVLYDLYGYRLTARSLGNMNVRYHCTDAESTKDSLILPWLMGDYIESRPSQGGSVIEPPPPESMCDQDDPKWSEVVSNPAESSCTTNNHRLIAVVDRLLLKLSCV